MTMTLISAAELAERLGGADLRVFDVRHDLMNHAAGRQAWGRPYRRRPLPRSRDRAGRPARAGTAATRCRRARNSAR